MKSLKQVLAHLERLVVFEYNQLNSVQYENSIAQIKMQNEILKIVKDELGQDLSKDEEYNKICDLGTKQEVYKHIHDLILKKFEEIEVTKQGNPLL